MRPVSEYKVIDCDSHVIEPADLWTSRMSMAKWGDKVPHIRWDESMGEEAWFTGDTRLNSAGSPAMAGWHEYPPLHPVRMSDIGEELIDPTARLRWMDRSGIWAQLLYPNVAGFGAGRFLGAGDTELALACVQAYNDFLAEYSSVDPRRYVPMMALPFWDLDLTAAEIERCAALGHKGIIMTSEPAHWGQPKLTDPYWDRLWAVAQDTEMSINFHIGSGDMAPREVVHASTGKHANFASMGAQFFMGNVRAISLLTTGGICHRFPRLNFVSVESGVGWVPFALDALDWQWKNCGVREEHPEYDLLPSEYFKRQIYAMFWFEEDTLRSTMDILGPDNLLYETDYPHPTAMTPGPATTAVSPEEWITRVLAGSSDDDLSKILHDNAARLYHLDPLPKVRALAS